MSNAATSPLPVTAQTFRPSVTGEGLDEFCFIFVSLPWSNSFCHNTLPSRFDRQINSSDWPPGSRFGPNIPPMPPGPRPRPRRPPPPSPPSPPGPRSGGGPAGPSTAGGSADAAFASSFAFSSFGGAAGDVTKMRSPQITGEPPLHDGKSARHTTCWSGPQVVGRPVLSLVPLAAGPRQAGQFSPA